MSSLAQYQLSIGIEVDVPNNRKGILKFVGKVDTKPGLFAGIELTDGSPGRNNGDFKSVSYFTVDVPMSGIFYSYESIARLNESKLPKRSSTVVNSRVSSRRIVSSGSTPISVSTSSNGRISPLSRSYSSRTSRSVSSSYISQSASSTPNRRYGASTITEESESAETSFGKSLSRPGSSASTGSRPSSRSDVRPMSGNGIRHVSSNGNFRTSNNNSRSSYTRSHDVLSPTSPNVISSGPQTDLFNKVKVLNSKCDSLLKENATLSREVNHYKSELQNSLDIVEEYKIKINEDLSPVIEEYQILLDQKENKIAKLKHSTEEQKNDLRNAITILEEQALENENLYQKEISNLKQRLMHSDGSTADKLTEKDNQIEYLLQQIKQMKLDSSDCSVSIKKFSTEDNKLIEDLKTDNSNLQLEFTKLQKSYEELQIKLEECIDDKKSQINSLRKNYTIELEEKSKQIIMLNNVMNDTFNDNSRSMEDSDSDDDDRIVELENQTRFLDSKLIESQKTIDSQSDKILKLESKIADNQLTIESQNEKLKNLEFKLSENQSVIDSLNKKLGTLKTSLSENEALLKHSNAEKVSSESELNVNSNFILLENQRLEQQLKQKESLIMEKELQIESMKTQMLENSEKYSNEVSKESHLLEKESNNKIDELEYAIDSFKATNRSLTEENKKLVAELDSIKSEIKVKANSEINTLKQQISVLESSSNRTQTVEKESQENIKKISDLSKDNKSLQTSLSSVKDQIVAVTESKNNISNLNDQLSTENKMLKNQIELLTKEIESAKVIKPIIEKNNYIIKETDDIILEKSPIKSDNETSINGEALSSLPIYKPPNSIDAAGGRSKWCGLCEREGHDSYECPFELDM